MIRRFVTVLSAAAALTASSAVFAPEAHAQEIQLTGPLAGAPAVEKLRLYREGRFEIAPTVSFSLLDEYRRTIFVGATLQYNFTDWFSVRVWGAGGLSSTTNLTDEIDTTAPRDQFTQSNVAPCIKGQPCSVQGGLTFTDQTAKISSVIAPELVFVPFRGKLAIFQKIFVDTDAYLHYGVGFVGLKEREDCGGTASVPCSDPSSFQLASRTAITLPGTYGLGLSFYINNFVSLGVDYRQMPFKWNRAGFDSHGSGTNGNFPDGQIDSRDRTFNLNQVISVSVGISLPTAPTISN